MSVNHPVSHRAPYSYMMTKPHTHTCQSVQNNWTPMHKQNQTEAITIQILFGLETICTCAFFWKRGIFLSAVSFWKVLFLFLYLVHVYIVSCIAQKRNNIKRIIFVVSTDFLAFVLRPLHKYRIADEEQQKPPASRQYDSNITDWDIYLYSPHCAGQIKWV